MSDGSKTTIGDYSVTRRLPGAGEVYQARSGDGRRVLVRLFGDSPGVDLEVVRRDVALSATLDHPAVARAIDVFDHAHQLVLVFDYFEGTQLAQIMKRPQSRKQLDETAIWHLGHRLAGALTQAHSATDPNGDMVAVCHGHLAPSQIVIAPKTGEMRIDGFGLAALVGSEELPAEGAYQAPEQAKGGRVTPRGDLYSVAAILWALLSGREPPAPSGEKLSVKELSARGPAELMEALDRALEPSVGRRKITSMELEQWLSDLADETAGAVGLGAAARAMVQSGRTLAGAGGLAAYGMAVPPVPGAGAVAPVEPDELGPAGTPPAVAVGGADMPFAQAAPAAPAMPGVPSRAEKVAKASALGRVGRKPQVRARQKTLLGAFPFGGGGAKSDELAAAPAPPPAAPPAATPPVPPVQAGKADKAARAAALGRAGAKGKSSVRSRQKTLLGAAPFREEGGEPATPAGPRQAGARGVAQGPETAGGTPLGPPVLAVPGAPDAADPAPPELAVGGPRVGLAAPGEPPVHDEEDVLEAALVGATVALPAAPEPATAAATSPDWEPESLERVVDLGAPAEPEAGSGPDEMMATPMGDEPLTPPPLAAEPALALGGGPVAGPPDELAGVVNAASPAVPTPADRGGEPLELGLAGPGAAPTAPSAAALPAGDSPWTEASEATAKPRASADRPLPLWQALLVALITAVLVAAVGLWWTRRQVTLSETPIDPAPGGSDSAAASAPPPAAATATDQATAEPSLHATATAAASAEASAEASADPTATASADADGNDGSALPPSQGLLLVHFDAPPEAQVYLLGKAYGPVNQKIAVPCGRTFIRVGRSPGPSWLSGGASVGVECQAVTEVTLAAP